LVDCAINGRGRIIGAMEAPARHIAGTTPSNVVEQVAAHRFATPVVRELTDRDMDEQRRLVRASLLMPVPRASVTRPAPRA
jgi:hypothetical protein